MIVICLLTEKKSISLNPTLKMSSSEKFVPVKPKEIFFSRLQCY